MSEATHNAVIEIPAADAEEMEAILKAGQRDEQTGEDDVIKTFTARFPDGLEADIKVCNAATDSGGPWVDAVLFDKRGYEVCICEPGESLLGRYEFDVPDLFGHVDHYILEVKKHE